MTTLEISLIGPVRVARDGAPVRGNAALLLAYLVTDAGAPKSREWLAQAFWPDRPLHKSLHSLRQVLLGLRSAPDHAPGVLPVLRSTEETVEIETGNDVQGDVAEFMSLFDACDAHVHGRLESCEPCLRRFSRAISLVRGNFCEGSSVWDRPMLEDWLRHWSAAIGDRTRCSLEILTVAQAAHRRWSDALHTATRWATVDPWGDAAQRWVMRALWRGGNGVAAMTQYESFRRVLANDLDSVPESETRALYEEIRADSRQ